MLVFNQHRKYLIRHPGLLVEVSGTKSNIITNITRNICTYTNTSVRSIQWENVVPHTKVLKVGTSGCKQYTCWEITEVESVMGIRLCIVGRTYNVYRTRRDQNLLVYWRSAICQSFSVSALELCRIVYANSFSISFFSLFV